LTPEGICFSVVTCAYTEDRSDRLAAALASERGQSRPAAETIVIVDHSPPPAGVVGGGRLPNVTVVPSAGRAVRARDTGPDRATGDVVAFLEDDARAAPTGSSGSPAATGQERWWASTGPCPPPSRRGAPLAAAGVRLGPGVQLHGLPRRRRRCGTSWGPTCPSGARSWSWSGASPRASAARTRPLAARRPSWQSGSGSGDPRPAAVRPLAVVLHHVSPQRTRWRCFRSAATPRPLQGAVSGVVGAEDALAAGRGAAGRPTMRAPTLLSFSMSRPPAGPRSRRRTPGSRSTTRWPTWPPARAFRPLTTGPLPATTPPSVLQVHAGVQYRPEVTSRACAALVGRDQERRPDEDGGSRR
jgi:glucosyl-dolichyl phosphate glucuronosyltransferase